MSKKNSLSCRVNKRTKRSLCWQEREERKLNETLQAINVIEMGNVIKTDIRSNSPQDFLIFVHLALSLLSTNTSRAAFFGGDDAKFFMLLHKVALKSIKDQFDGGKMFEKVLSVAMRYAILIITLQPIDSTTSINTRRERKQRIPEGEN
jgi:hypothetical protein